MRRNLAWQLQFGNALLVGQDLDQVWVLAIL